MITPMNFIVVKDAVSQFLANARDKQVEKVTLAGKSEPWIENNIYFNVYSNRLKPLDVSDLPCVCIYFEDTSFNESEQYPDTNYADATLRLDLYALGVNEFDADGNEIITSSDENANARLGYLLSQIYKTLSSESAFYLGTEKFLKVKERKLEGWSRILDADDDSSESILGISLKYRLGFDEPTESLDSEKLKNIYLSLNIKDEYIDPFVKINFLSEGE